MTQLRLVWSCKNLENASPGTKKKLAKCGPSGTHSERSLSILKKFERLHRERPHAAAMVERLVDQALADLDKKVVSGVVLE